MGNLRKYPSVFYCRGGRGGEGWNKQGVHIFMNFLINGGHDKMTLWESSEYTVKSGEWVTKS